VLDPCIQIGWATNIKAKSRIKPNGLNLRTQFRLGYALQTTCDLKRFADQSGPNTPPSRRRKNANAANFGCVTSDNDARCAHGPALVPRQKVDGGTIIFVNLFFDWNVLLVDKHNATQLEASFKVVSSLDPNAHPK
jgi:hypothetical protein